MMDGVSTAGVCDGGRRTRFQDGGGDEGGGRTLRPSR